MALTISGQEFHNRGDQVCLECNVAFDNSYAYGGETFDYTLQAMEAADRVVIEPQGGYSFEYDYTNKKIKVFHAAPYMVVEEKHTIATNAITLDYPAAYIMSVAQANAPLHITDADATLAANQCKPTADFAAGVRGGLTFHAGLSGAVYVTYITQAWKDVWDNLVQGETVTITTHSGNLAYDACAIQSIRSSAGTTPANSVLMLDKSDTAATGEAMVDFTPATGNTQLVFATADAITAAVVSYIKCPSSGFLADRFVEAETFTASSNVNTPAYPMLLWGFAGQCPENGVATERIINIGGTQGANEAFINWWHSDTIVDMYDAGSGEGTYIKGRPFELDLEPLEVRNATDLSGLSAVKVEVIGH